jgi:TP901 family phage tail tape measure protein
MPIKVPVTQTGLEQSIQNAATKAGKNLKINMGPGAKSVEGLTRPLGRLTGKADEFTKSMEAANARVLAFGASVGVIAAVSNGLKQLVTTSIQVEKSLTNINSILKQSESQLDGFKNQIFDIAKNTGQTFDTVAEAALELSRQGLKAEEVTKRLNDALVLSRLSGLSAADSVAGLTAAVNSFSSAGLTTSDVLNKISAAAASAAVSDRDLIEGLKRSGAVAVASGVKFDELIGIISALQERTARGGAVIGNSLKTIFVRIQDLDRLKSLQTLGVEVTDLGGQVLSSSKIIENLAPVFGKLDQASKVNLADNLVGKFQIAPFLALLEDYNQKISRSGEVAATSFGATNEAYERNKTLNTALAAAINAATVSVKELANALGEIGVTENLSKIIGVFNSVVSSITGILDGDGIGSKFAKGLIKGIGAVIAGPGLAIALLAIGKLLLDFAKFGGGALKTFFGLNRAAEAQKNLQGQIAASLLNDKGIRSAILSIEKQNISEGEKKKLQTSFFTKALNEQLMVMQKMQGIARTIAPGVMAGTASTRGGRRGRAAGGFLPIGAERSDISRGVGGAPASAKPVVIPNFAFGGGKRGTMVANSSEYIVPNYANGGDAIFNQNMASSMGLPANARKVRAASGYIPNFAAGPAGALSAAGITSMTQFNALPGKKGQVSKVVNGVKVSPAQAKLAFDRKKKGIGKRSYMANKEPNKSIMLVPKRERFLLNGSDHKFLNPHKSTAGNGLIDFFEGPSAGISKRLKKDSVEGGRFKTLLTLDGDIEKALARGVNGIFTKFRRKAGPNAFKTSPNKITASNIKEQMEKGGPGALGAIKGATFEALMTAIVGGLSQDSDGGQLDIDFSKDEGDILDKIFGITGKNFKFGDFKSSRSGGNKTKFAKQVIDNVKGKVEVGRKAKTVNSKTAASGYIPNFAEGALEEAVGREKAAGLPVSQIRINQSGKLRNSQNPMGLAVTNTRDEPTGAVPNFAKGKGGDGGGDGGGSSDMLAKLFAVQMGFTGLSAMLGEVTEKNKLVAGSLTALNTVVMTMMTAQAFGGFKNIGSFLMGKGMVQGAAGKIMPTGMTKGLSSLKGGLLKAGAGLARFAGPVGLAVVGVGLLTKAYMSSFDSLMGVSESVEMNNKKVAEGAKQAAEELSKIKAPEEFKEKFKTDAESVAKRIVQRHSDDIEGFSDEKQLASIETSIANSLKKGISFGVMDSLTRELFSEDNRKRSGSSIFTGDIPTEDVDAFIRNNKVRSSERGTTQDVIDNIAKKITPEDAQRHIDLEEARKGIESLKDIRKDLSEADAAVLQSTQQANAKAKFEDKHGVGSMQATSRFKFDLSQETKTNKDLVDLAMQQKIAVQKQKTAAIEKINLEVAKKRIDHQLKLLKSEFKSASIMEKNLERDKKFNILGREKTLQLEKRIAIHKLELKFHDDQVEALRAQAKELKGLEANNQKLVGLTKLITESTEDGTVDLADREAIGKKINEILLTGGDIEGANFDLILRTLDLEDKILKKLIQQTKEKHNQKKLNSDDAAALEKVRNNIRFGAQGLTDTNAIEFSRLQTNFNINTRGLGEQSERADFLGEDSKQRAADAKIRAAKATLAADQQRLITQAQFDSRAKNITIPAAASVALRGEGSFAGLTDKQILKMAPGAAAEDAKSITSSDDILQMGAAVDKLFGGELSENKEIAKFQEETRKLRTDLAKNSQEVRDNTDQLKRAPLTLDQLSELNFQRADNLAPFSSAEAGEARRLGQAQKMGGNTGLNFRRLTMERDVGTRFFELVPTDLENADKLSQSIADSSFQFAHNIGDAMLDAIQKGENLGDILLGTAADFLATMSRAFMDSAVNDFLGGFGIGKPEGKQAGGPIRGGSGTKDDIPAMLMGGEFVMNKKAVKKYGLGFMSALNSGSMQGFASGGEARKDFLRPSPSLGGQSMDREGMFTTPGMNGAEKIVGARNLLSFATQTPIALNRDTIDSSGAFLDAESGRLSMFGRRNSPQFQKVQDAKRQAFGLFLSEMDAHRQAAEQQKANKKALMKSLKAGAISLAAGAAMKSMASGFKAARDSGASIPESLKAMFTGSDFAGTSYGGLKNIFSVRGFQSGPPKAQIVNENPVSPVSAPSKPGFFSGIGSKITDFGSKMFEPFRNFGGGSGGGMPSTQSAHHSDGRPSMLPPPSAEDMLRLFPTHRATGGLIPAAGGVDTVPAMLSGGEFVMNAAATRNIGAGNLQSLNSGAGTGDNTDLVSKLDELIIATETSQSTGDINITINGSNGGETETQGQNSTDQQKMLSDKIKTAVKQVLADEKRLGGQLRR